MPKKRGLSDVPKMNEPRKAGAKSGEASSCCGEEWVPMTTVFLSTMLMILVGSMIIWRISHFWGALYFIFYLVVHFFLDRYFLCTKCSYFGENCNSVLFGGKLANFFYDKKKGDWSIADSTAASITWSALFLIPFFFALSNGRWLVLFLFLIATANFYFVHDFFACEKCTMLDKCFFGKLRFLWKK